MPTAQEIHELHNVMKAAEAQCYRTCQGTPAHEAAAAAWRDARDAWQAAIERRGVGLTDPREGEI